MLRFRVNLPLTLALAGFVLAGAAVGAAVGQSTPTTDGYAATTSDDLAPLSAVAQIGRLMFFDAALSGSGKMSCASCHDPANHYAPSNDLAVQLGGPHLDLPGRRAVPTLTYKLLTPAFTVGPSLDGDNDSIVQGQLSGTPHAAGKAATTTPDLVPQGGMFWDGRDDTLQEQPLGPLLSPFEMANASKAALFATLKARPYAKTLEQLFGAQVMTDQNFMISEAAFALARYQIEEPSFHPFTSKYDYYLAGKAKLTADEAAGLRLFNNPNKGDCNACHLDTVDASGNPPMFTDYEYEALGVPRNDKIPANADPNYFDLGICGPMRTDPYAHQAANCGLFKTPTLRNVASRHVFFHNGVFTSLEDVVRWYVDRDTDPARFYPRAKDGGVLKFNDLPWQYRGNIDVIDAPLDRHPGQQPALDDREIAQVVAFLRTLTDGYAADGQAAAR